MQLAKSTPSSPDANEVDHPSGATSAAVSAGSRIVVREENAHGDA